MANFKLVMVSGTLPPLACGVGQYTGRLLEALRPLTPSLSVVTTTQSQQANTVVVPGSWRLRDLGRITRAIRREQPSVIHIQYPTTAYGRRLGINLLPLMLRITLPRTPVVVTLHEYHDASLLGRIRIYLTQLFAHKVIVSNQQDYDQLSRLWPAKQRQIIPIGINLDNSQIKPERTQELLQQFKLKPQNFVVYFGIIDPSKGLTPLIASAANWSHQAPLVLVANFDPNDPYHQQLKRQIDAQPGTIIWTGYLDNNDSSAIIAAASIGILPFNQAATLRRSTLLTLMNHGIPTITTGPVALPLQTQVNCLATATNEPATLTKAVSELLASAELRRILKVHGQQLVTMFDWKTIAQDHYHLYQELAARR